MIEKTFNDRVPTYPGRVKLVPVSGQENTYDMVRADSPVVVGSPINKAAFDSIIHSRLTGRFYQPTVTRAVASSRTGLTTNPIPTSGWTDTSNTRAVNGSYIVTASGSYGSTYSPENAFMDEWATNGGWRSENGSVNPWIAIDFGTPIVIRGMDTWYTAEHSNTQCELQGSNDGSGWTQLVVYGGLQDGRTAWSISNTTPYRYYRLYFTQNYSTDEIRLYGWAITLYDVTVYRNVYTVADGWPTSWTIGQRVTIQMPSTVNTIAVASNTLNGVTVSTILQLNKRYELRYTGSTFVAKEV